MPVDRPVFIVGPPRSGTSLLYQCLARFPEIGYFSRVTRKLPRHPRLGRWLTRLGVFSDRPRESRYLWNRFHDGDDDVLGPEAARPEVRTELEQRIEGVLRARRARRFVAKLPALSLRVPWLDALFPDALYLEAVRDWRAVVSSTVLKRERDFPGWWFGVRVPGWRDHEAEPPELGATWQFLAVYAALERERQQRPERFHAVWYEELCREPSRIMQEVAEFCNLSWTPAVEAAVRADLRPPSDRWRQHLSPETIERIRAVHGDALLPYECGSP